MGPPTFGAPGNCPICRPLKPALVRTPTPPTVPAALIVGYPI